MTVVADIHAIICYITEPNKQPSNTSKALKQVVNNGDFI
jgi:hypothetical protein